MSTSLPAHRPTWLCLHLWKMVAVLPLALPLYLVRLKIGPLPTTALEIILVIIFVIFLITFGVQGWKSGAGRLGKFCLPILAWCVASFVAVLWSPDIYHGFGLWRAYILEPILLLLVIVHEFQDERRREVLRFSMYALVWVLTIWGVIQFATGFGIPSPWNVSIADGRRATGPFPFPNALALLTAPIGAYALARGLRKAQSVKCKAQIEFLTFGAALGAALVARSDGAMVALVAVAVGLLLLEKRFRLMGIGIVTIGVIALAAFPSVRANVWKEATFQSWSGRVRVWMWEETWQMLNSRPITGAGFGGYQTVIKPYHQKAFIEIFEYPHNIVLNMWSETGLLGLVTFIWIMVTWGRVTRHATRDTRLTSIAVIGVILIHGLVDVPYFKNDLAVMFWMLVALTAILEQP